MDKNFAIVILKVIRWTVETKQSVFQGIGESISKDVEFIEKESDEKCPLDEYSNDHRLDWDSHSDDQPMFIVFLFKPYPLLC